ncbi:uncharacterized protein LOC119068875 isoform X1 [Bradysia coprophila]|uniref:uncharacterized protein LOC119068875 isoform X1 n=2 Tax=Bradysia coprophila TaxID=38358 RepID=UPI00187D9D25|nr:uncharacterized protein LOC119068875 isoform X1 [Bradysia coprophila]
MEMDLVVPAELEELILCSCCHLPFNDTDALPKLFSCRHHFCLKCVNSILLKSGELYCVHCWKRTELPAPDMKPESLPTHTAILYLAQNLSMLNMKKAPDKSSSQHSTSIQQQANQHQKGENCHTHAMPNGLWCLKCHMMICRACAGAEEHRSHSVKTQNEARDTIRGDVAGELITMQKTLVEVQHLVLKQREFLLKILEACTALKTQIETELINHMPTLEIAEMRESLGKAKLCLGMLEQQSPTEAYKLYSTLHLEKQRLQSKHQEMYLQCKLDDLIRHYGSLFDFDLIKQALAGLQSGDQAISSISMNGSGHQNQVLLLANYCISQLYSRHVLTNKQQQLLSNSNGHYTSQTTSQMLTSSPHEVKTFAEIAGSPKGVTNNNNNNNNNNSTNINNNYLTDSMVNHQTSGGVRHSSISYMSSDLNGIAMMQHLQHSGQQQMSSAASTLVQSPQSSSTIICNPTVHVYPIYYFNIEINGSSCGRILIEVRNDVAPKMAKNFGALSTGELGFGYKGCQIFQCWENESIITGDFELNNGRGGRSVFEEGFFMPDDTKILAIRGSVGMRRSQKRHDNMGLVGSQFRIILREMRGFTGIFAFVVEGLELVEKISQAGDSAGKPQSSVMVVSCGKLQ